VQISLPRPSLVLLIGSSGSGKSTFARSNFRSTEIVSSDTCRALVSDDEADQSATKDAFELLNWLVEKRLQRGKLTVVDATSVQAWSRASLLAIAKQRAVPAVAVVFDLPPDIVAAQNLARASRTVDPEIIAQQNRDLQISLRELPNEGFAAVYILRSSDDVNAAEFRPKN